jgi:2-dehydropantoate 2-reductase
MRIMVVGAGATGGYFGGRLAQAGQDVTFLVRPARARILRERGLRIVGLGEDERIEPRLLTADRIEQPFDLVLLSVKATGLEHAIDDVAPAVGAETSVLPILNGMRHIDLLAERLGPEAVLGGVALLATMLDDEGDVVRLADTQQIAFGRLDGATDARVEQIRRALTGAGFAVDLVPDIEARMWAKWVYIAAVGAVTCLMRGTVGEVVAVPGGRNYAERVLAEIAAVSAAAGFPVPDDQLASTRAAITAPGSPLTSSMYRDLQQGNAVEVEHVFADLLVRAGTLGIETSLLALVTTHLRVHQHRVEAARAGR